MENSEVESYFSPKYILMFFIVIIVICFAGFMYIGNKKMMESGIHQKLNKKSHKKKSK